VVRGRVPVGGVVGRPGATVVSADNSILLERSAVYIGPDALMPLASVFAAVAGFVLLFWRRLAGAARFLVRRMSSLFARR
jgi:hypothetical protein